MAMITSTATGNFSAGATWVGGVAPADLDGFTVAAGHVVTFDMDQSAWAGMAASTIAATGTLICDTTAGSYVLKMNADLTVAGTLQAGTSLAVPLPSTVTFIIDFSSGSNSIVITADTGLINLWCTEPTIKYVSTTQQDLAGQKVLTVDGDVSSDWFVGDTIAICDLIAPGTSTADNEEDTIAAMTATTITCTGNLANNKETGAKVVLVTRNIRIINTTDYAIKNGNNTSTYIAVEFNNCTYCTSTIYYPTFGGVMYVKTRGIYAGSGITFNGVIVQSGNPVTTFGIVSAYGVVVGSEALICGVSHGITGTYCLTFAGEIAACRIYGFNGTHNVSFTGDIKGVNTGFRSGSNVWFYGTTANVTTSFSLGYNYVIANAELGNSIGGVTSSNDFYRTDSVVCYNTLFQATTEFNGYGDPNYRQKWTYCESFDHDQTANAFKAWCVGGVVSSQTASPPSGYDIWYEHACEDVDYPCFRQFETTVQPGTAIEVEGYIRIADAADHTAHPPALQIVDKFNDPLVDSTASYLDEDEIGDPDGSDSSWQAVNVIWANTGDSPKQVIVRMYAQHASGDVDEVWSIADYKDQISDILKKVKRLGPTGEIT